ncbi:MAG: DUF4337 family protein [Alphaproteobacteria bacterium]|nr:DUF4337 family protein [Alphaproteobacteria bacterium]
MEAVEAKDLIEEAIERVEEKNDEIEKAERLKERSFRERVSLMVGGFAVALAVIHMAAAGAQRESVLKQIEASDSFAYMQAKIVRETVLKTAAASSGATDADKKSWIEEAIRLRAPSNSGHGIGQLQEQGTKQHEEGLRAAKIGEAYELGETGLQLAIVLLSIALITRSLWIAGAASGFAIASIALAAATHFGLSVF